MLYRALIVIATIIWGSSFVIVKDATEYLDPTWILVLRFFPAAVVMALFCIKKHRLYFKPEYIGIGSAFGVLLFCAYFLQTWGVSFTTPGKNAFLTGIYCVLVPFVAWFVTKKAPTAYNIIAALLSIAGIGLISLGSESGLNIGDVLTLSCSVFYALHIVIVSRFSQGRDIFILTMWQFFSVGVLALVVILTTRTPLPPFYTFNAEQWGAIAYLSFACTTLALLFQNVGQKHLPPASASLLLSLESPFGTLFSVLVGTDVVSAKIFLGFALIFIAVLVSEVLPDKLKTSRLDA